MTLCGCRGWNEWSKLSNYIPVLIVHTACLIYCMLHAGDSAIRGCNGLAHATVAPLHFPLVCPLPPRGVTWEGIVVLSCTIFAGV